MFENSLVGLQRKKGARQRWLSLPLAVVLHLVVLSSLVFAQYWNIDKVPEPHVNEPLPPVPVSLSPPIAQRGTVAPTPTHHSAPAVVPDRPLQPAQPTAENSPPVPSPAPADKPQVGVSTGAGNGNTGGATHGGANGGQGELGSIVVSEAPTPPPESAVLYRSDMTRPQLVYQIKPQYTELARRSRLQGTVIVQATIDESGNVRDVRVLKGLQMGLDRSAVDAVSQWRFTPATLNGRALKVLYTLTINFTVQ